MAARGNAERYTWWGYFGQPWRLGPRPRMPRLLQGLRVPGSGSLQPPFSLQGMWGLNKPPSTLLNASPISFIQSPVCVWKYSSSLFILCHKNDIFEEIIMNKVANLAGRFTRKTLSKKYSATTFSGREKKNAVWAFRVIEQCSERQDPIQ